jgi:hypothetical protein
VNSRAATLEVSVPRERLPKEAEGRDDLLQQYFCEVLAQAKQDGETWKIDLRRPNKLDVYVDPEIGRGLRWWRREIGPIKVEQIPSSVVRRWGYVLSCNDAWTLLTWSEWFHTVGLAPEQTLTVLHVDDHRDFMSPRIATDDAGLRDMLTNRPVMWDDPASIASAITSGAIGMGSFFVPMLSRLKRVDLRQLTQRTSLQVGGTRSLHLVEERDTLIDPKALRPAIAIVDTASTSATIRYTSTSDHAAWLRGVVDGPVLLHIDMDYFSNRYNGDSDAIGKPSPHDPTQEEVIEEIDRVFAALGETALSTRIVSCHVALSPGFFTGDLWEIGIRRIEHHIRHLSSQHLWGAAKHRGLTQLIEQSESIDKGSNGRRQTQVSLVEGKGSKTRGGEPGGRYWHVFAQGHRVGCVFINRHRNERGERPSLQIFLSASARGKGYGRVAYRLACEQSGYDEVYVEMRKSNIASRKAAEAAGFVVDAAGAGHQLAMVWRRGRKT